MTRGDIPCHLFKKTFQSSTSPPDSPLFFPCTPQNLPLLPILASPVMRSSNFLPFSPFLSRPAGESPTAPTRACPYLPFCRVRREHPPAEQPSAASGKNGHNKNRKPSGSRLFSVLSKSGYTARGSTRGSDNRSPSSSKMRSTCASAAMCSRWICRSEYPMCSAASAQVKLHW